MTTSHDTFDEKVSAIADYIGRDFMRLARELKELQEIKSDAFGAVIDKLKIGRRRAYALARIARIFENLGVSDDRLNRIGWTKLNRIGTHLTESNAGYLLDLAETRTAHELDLILKGESPVDDARVLLFYLTEEDHSAFCNLLAQFGAKKLPNGGLLGKETALMKLVSAALQGIGSSKTK